VEGDRILLGLELYALALLATDATEYTHLIAAFALPVALALVKELDVKYLAIGLVANLSPRILAVGAESGTLKKPGFGLYAFAALLELRLIYPNAITRYSGIWVYYLPEFLGFSLLVALALLLDPYLMRKPTLASIIYALSAYGKNPGVGLPSVKEIVDPLPTWPSPRSSSWPSSTSGQPTAKRKGRPTQDLQRPPGLWTLWRHFQRFGRAEAGHMARSGSDRGKDRQRLPGRSAVHFCPPRLLAEASPVAQIIAGDTNAEPDEKTIEILTRDYRDAFPKRPPHTFLWERNRVVDRENIDYILLKRGRR